MVGVVIAATSNARDHARWEFALCNFQVDQLWLYGDGQVTGSVLSTGVRLADVSELPADVPIVLLAPPNGTNISGDVALPDFTHPESAIYWFGSDHRHLEAEVFENRAPDHRVYVPTDTIDQMFSDSAYLVTMWDRRHGHR